MSILLYHVDSSVSCCFFKSAKGVELRIGTANVGTLRGRSGEVVEMVGRRRLDFLLSAGNQMERGGNKDDGGVQGLLEGL